MQITENGLKSVDSEYDQHTECSIKLYKATTQIEKRTIDQGYVSLNEGEFILLLFNSQDRIVLSALPEEIGKLIDKDNYYEPHYISDPCTNCFEMGGQVRLRTSQSDLAFHKRCIYPLIDSIKNLVQRNQDEIVVGSL